MKRAAHAPTFIIVSLVLMALVVVIMVAAHRHAMNPEAEKEVRRRREEPAKNHDSGVEIVHVYKIR